MSTPSIYVACLAAYNNGFLHGAWIDATQAYDDVLEAIQSILKTSPEPDAEEYAIHDYEGFCGYRVQEYSNIEEICEIAQILDSDQGEIIVALMDHLGSGTTIEDAKEFLENNYQGCHKDLGEYVYDFYHDCYDMDKIPQLVACHIDWDLVGRDMEWNGDIFTLELDHETHVFSNR